MGGGVYIVHPPLNDSHIWGTILRGGSILNTVQTSGQAVYTTTRPMTKKRHNIIDFVPGNHHICHTAINIMKGTSLNIIGPDRRTEYIPDPAHCSKSMIHRTLWLVEPSVARLQQLASYVHTHTAPRVWYEPSAARLQQLTSYVHIGLDYSAIATDSRYSYN